MTRNEIAENLGVSKEALAMCISRLEKDCGEKFPQLLDLSQYYMVLEAYTKPNPRRPKETSEKAKALQQALKVENKNTSNAAAQVVVNINTPAANEPAAAPQPAQAPGTDYQGDVRQTHIAFRVFLYTVFISVLAWQIHHTALLEFSISKFGGSWAVLLSCLYAIGVQFTALLLTIRKASKKFLVGAAICEFCINILCYYPQPVLSVVLISAISAFTIYSYSELFIKK